MVLFFLISIFQVVHIRIISPPNTVNIFSALTVSFRKTLVFFKGLANRSPHFSVNKLCIRIHWRISEILYDDHSSLKERRRSAESNINVERFWDNPRRLGKGWVRLVDQAPLKRIARFAEAEFTSSSDTFACVSNAKKELGGEKR